MSCGRKGRKKKKVKRTLRAQVREEMKRGRVLGHCF